MNTWLQKRRGPGSVGALPEAENQNHRGGNSIPNRERIGKAAP